MTMQPDELKSLRQQIGMTQSDFAERLGLTPQFIGMMERGEKAIEIRTALAARHVFNEESQPWGAMERGEYDGDIPLANAMIIWDDDQSPRIKVVGHPHHDDTRYSSSACASDQGWRTGGKPGQLARLLGYVPYWIIKEGIDPREVHDALWVIPEYRHAVAFDFAMEKGVRQ